MTRIFYCCKISYQWWWFQILFQRLKTKLFKFLTKVYWFSLRISLFLLFLVFVFETAAVYKISPKIDILLQLFQKIRNPQVFGNFGENLSWWKVICNCRQPWILRKNSLCLNKPMEPPMERFVQKLKSKAKALKPAGNRTPY